jgi:hypothetical protein
MRKEISAKELPDYVGRDIYLFDEESKREQKLERLRIEKGWARAWNRTGNCYVDLLLSYNLTKIFVDL